MNNEKLCTITNRSPGYVKYVIEDMHVSRTLSPGETFRVPEEEMFRLVQQNGGRTLIYDYIFIHEPDVAERVLNIKLVREPEYNMTVDQVKAWMPTCSLDAFKDALEFGPQGVKDIIRAQAVKMKLNDVAKREAIKKYLGFDVTKAIEMQQEEVKAEEDAAANRRLNPEATTAAKPAATTSSERRVKVIGNKES